MPNYADHVPLPHYRNLAINPNGKPTYSATWRSNNGDVNYAPDVGHTGVSGSIRYVVKTKSAKNYSFGPMGPDGNVHVNRFKISPTGSASAKLWVRAGPNDVWVRLVLVWYAKTWPNGTSKEPVLAETGDRTELDSITKLDGAGAWKKLHGRVGDNASPKGATHFQVLVQVYGSGGANPDPPPIGRSVYADDTFVPDNGRDVENVATVIGNVAGAVWEGDPNHSTSTNKPSIVNPGTPTNPDPGGTDPDPDPDPGGEDDEETNTVIPPVGPDGQSPDSPLDPTPPSDRAPTPPKATDALGLPPWGGSAGTAVVEDLPPDPGIRGPAAVVIAEGAATVRPNGRNFRLNRDVQISNLVLNAVDSTGVAWVVTDIDGWWTMPEPDVPDQPRSWFDGSYETRGRFAARTFTLNGSFIPSHPSQLAQARDRLFRAVNLVHKGGWFMTHEDPVRFTRTRGSKVWMVGQPLVSTASASGKTDFAVTFRAPDPVKYGIKDGIPPGYEMLRLQTSAAEYPERAYDRSFPWAYPEAVFGVADTVAVNNGNVVVQPVLRMRGPTNGPVRIINATTQQTLRITRQLHEGEEIIVNCATKQVTMNGSGNFRFYLDIDADWLMLQPGENKLYFREEELGGIRTELEVLWRSGWIG